ncbi:hypothetical protein PSCICO_17390 [Pseudomonas cichorii]|jgi:hypothetical protein|uniref:hypothetical protein n=1 Tax=Pseudomonas cichorii TaxID=36746 RepID=UPI0019100875|nr:hypothetical protein [Pseudomonas cichorii]GFM86340.1 hypothetical protein PSCICO_17390 [Pseudomonas cichorii]
MTNQIHDTAGAVYFPPALLAAVMVTFDEHVDGYLLDARVCKSGYRAAIFFDASGKHGNGDTLTTGEVVQVQEQHGYHLITTIDNQRYAVVSYMMLLLEDSEEGEHFQILSLTHTGRYLPSENEGKAE